MKIRFNPEKFIQYIKVTLLTLLVTIEIIACAQAYPLATGIPGMIALVACCFVLAAIEAINAFAIKGFIAKMVLYGLEFGLLLAICVLIGSPFLSTLYCIVCTESYMTVERFRDRTIIFGVSCGLYTISFIVGWVIANPSASVLNSIVEIFSGVLLGLIAISVDYIVVQFLLKFYHTNLELSEALKEADTSRKQLSEVYEQLTRTKVYEERNRIARDIHDNAGHSLTTVIMQTEAAKLLIDENPAEAKNRIISANIQARNALDQMRESVHLLAGRPQTHSLREELEEIIAQTIDGTEIKARYDISEIPLDDKRYRYICNTLKELLANGIRHGNATAFYIELKEDSGNIILLVTDNGSGVEGEIVPGFGLRGISEKAAKLNGKCNYSSEAGDGFEAEITIPLTDGGEEVKND